jgi:hypothetical protein
VWFYGLKAGHLVEVRKVVVQQAALIGRWQGHLENFQRMGHVGHLVGPHECRVSICADRSVPVRSRNVTWCGCADRRIKLPIESLALRG